MAAELPGAAFLQRRLARAQALPPAERSPEVQAFITSVELGRQACELLPLRQGGGGGAPQPALPLGDPDTACRVLRAALLVVQADYVCPEPAVFSPDCFLHLDAYMPALQQAAETLHGSCQDLAPALCAYVRLCRLSDLQAEKWHRHTAALSAALTQSSSSTVIAYQLEQLMGEQPASQESINMIARQLECACHALLVDSAPLMLCPSGPGAAQPVPAESTVDAVRQRLQGAASAWMQLEPDRLNAVARTALAFSNRQLRQSDQASLDRVLRALQLAQRQRSQYWIVLTAAVAALIALNSTVQAGQLRTVVDSFSAVEQALRSCKRLLPHAWVDGLEAAYQAAAAGMPVLRSRLAELDSPAQTHSAASAFVSAVPANQEQMRAVYSVLQQRIQEDASQCAGCGRSAVGLRTCARCRTAHYCSRECQAAHWPQHRQQCRPA